jgi:hypothetical protein
MMIVCYKCKKPIPVLTKFVWCKLIFNHHGKRVIRPNTIESFHIDCAKAIGDYAVQDKPYYTWESSWVYGMMLQGGDL